MTGTVARAIYDEPALKRNPLATVTEHYLVIRKPERHEHVIIPLSRIARMDVFKRPYSGLLAIAGAAFVLSAAAFTSSEGDGFGYPLAAAGMLVLLGYVASRRAEIRLLLDSGLTESIAGHVGEAESLVKIIKQASNPRAIPRYSLAERILHLIPMRWASVRNT